jgi:hypothetical protein
MHRRRRHDSRSRQRYLKLYLLKVRLGYSLTQKSLAPCFPRRIEPRATVAVIGVADECSEGTRTNLVPAIHYL